MILFVGKYELSTWHLSPTIVCLSNIQIWGSTGRERFPGNKMPVTNIVSILIILIKIILVLTI